MQSQGIAASKDNEKKLENKSNLLAYGTRLIKKSVTEAEGHATLALHYLICSTPDLKKAIDCLIKAYHTKPLVLKLETCTQITLAFSCYIANAIAHNENQSEIIQTLTEIAEQLPIKLDTKNNFLKELRFRIHKYCIAACLIEMPANLVIANAHLKSAALMDFMGLDNLLIMLRGIYASHCEDESYIEKLIPAEKKEVSNTVKKFRRAEGKLLKGILLRNQYITELYQELDSREIIHTDLPSLLEKVNKACFLFKKACDEIAFLIQESDKYVPDQYKLVQKDAITQYKTQKILYCELLAKKIYAASKNKSGVEVMSWVDQFNTSIIELYDILETDTDFYIANYLIGNVNLSALRATSDKMFHRVGIDYYWQARLYIPYDLVLVIALVEAHLVRVQAEKEISIDEISSTCKFVQLAISAKDDYEFPEDFKSKVYGDVHGAFYNIQDEYIRILEQLPSKNDQLVLLNQMIESSYLALNIEKEYRKLDKEKPLVVQLIQLEKKRLDILVSLDQYDEVKKIVENLTQWDLLPSVVLRQYLSATKKPESKKETSSKSLTSKEKEIRKSINKAVKKIKSAKRSIEEKKDYIKAENSLLEVLDLWKNVKKAGSESQKKGYKKVKLKALKELAHCYSLNSKSEDAVKTIKRAISVAQEKKEFKVDYDECQKKLNEYDKELDKPHIKIIEASTQQSSLVSSLSVVEEKDPMQERLFSKISKENIMNLYKITQMLEKSHTAKCRTTGSWNYFLALCKHHPDKDFAKQFQVGDLDFHIKIEYPKSYCFIDEELSKLSTDDFPIAKKTASESPIPLRSTETKRDETPVVDNFTHYDNYIVEPKNENELRIEISVTYYNENEKEKPINIIPSSALELYFSNTPVENQREFSIKVEHNLYCVVQDNYGVFQQCKNNEFVITEFPNPYDPNQKAILSRINKILPKVKDKMKLNQIAAKLMYNEWQIDHFLQMLSSNQQESCYREIVHLIKTSSMDDPGCLQFYTSFVIANLFWLYEKPAMEEYIKNDLEGLSVIEKYKENKEDIRAINIVRIQIGYLKTFVGESTKDTKTLLKHIMQITNYLLFKPNLKKTMNESEIQDEVICAHKYFSQKPILPKIFYSSFFSKPTDSPLERLKITNHATFPIENNDHSDTEDSSHSSSSSPYVASPRIDMKPESKDKGAGRTLFFDSPVPLQTDSRPLSAPPRLLYQYLAHE